MGYSRLTFRSNKRREFCCRSISRLPQRSVSPCHPPRSWRPTMWSN